MQNIIQLEDDLDILGFNNSNGKSLFANSLPRKGKRGGDDQGDSENNQMMRPEKTDQIKSGMQQ